MHIVFVLFAGYVIDFQTADLGTIAEGQFITDLRVTESGFIYGSVPVFITPLPCSDYSGNLTALFDNVPPASASIGML